MSTGGSRSRTERMNQVKTPAGGQKVLKAANPGSLGPSPNSSKRGQNNKGASGK